MNQRHPIDDLFRRRLENHSVDPPMHLWERIEESRRRAGVVAGPSRLSSLLIAICTAATVLIPRSEWHPVEHSTAQELPVQAAATVAPAPAAEGLSGEDIAHAQAPAQEAPAIAFAALPPAPVSGSASLQTMEAAAGALETGLYEEEEETESAVLANENSGAEMLRDAYAAFLAEPIPGSSLKLLTRSRNFPETSKCASFSKIGLRLHLELLASPDLPLRQIAPRSNSLEDAEYARRRENSEQPDFSYSFSARVSASTNFGLTLRSGVNFSQLNERLRYLTETEERFTIINIIGPGGNIIGIDTVYETIHREHTVLNRYRSIDIPVLAGYELPVKRWLFSAHGGVFINMLFRQQGSMYLPEGDMPASFASLEQEGAPAFNNRLGVGWYAGAGVAFKVRHNLQIMAEPYLRAWPGSFTTAQFPTRQSYLHSGLALGLRYQI